jgi:transcriptional regulator EpsA
VSSLPSTGSSPAEALLQAAESAFLVGRRHQFFIWSQSQLQRLLPHTLAVCGAYQRSRKALAFELFNSVPLSAPVLAALAEGQGPLLRGLMQAWCAGRGQSLWVDVAAFGAGVIDAGLRAELLAAGLDALLVHGVARPQRPDEIESLFVFASPGRATPLGADRQRHHLDLLLPHLHSCWLRVQAVERGLRDAPAQPAGLPAPVTLLTERERQVLRCVRAGMSNQRAGEALGISPLTVKNHVQNLLRKLGAVNRAQALAQAMAMSLLDDAPAAGLGLDARPRQAPDRLPRAAP